MSWMGWEFDVAVGSFLCPAFRSVEQRKIVSPTTVIDQRSQLLAFLYLDGLTLRVSVHSSTNCRRKKEPKIVRVANALISGLILLLSPVL
jgi:hypothetical protein